MVLKEKEDLCNWFKDLHPRKRIDYMCGLLHLCLPLELRFIGTVLEDIAKKDFNYLRDAENRANNPSEWSNDGPTSFTDSHFRAKIQITLALMHSADGSCADILFGILEKQLNNLSNYSQDEQVLEEILTILTLACHHPAFKIKQRLRLGEILKNAEDQCHHLWRSPVFPKHFQTYPSMQTSNKQSKDIITSIFVNGIRDEVHNKKSGPDYEIHATWSNGEVTQHFMKHKELQNLHNQIFNKFPDEKRLQQLFPSVPAQRRYRHESKEEKIAMINSYFSELSKAQRILECHILTRAFQNGKPIPIQPFSHPIYYPPYIPENRFYGHFPEGYRVYTHPPGLSMIGAPATILSSATTSPSNSRASSPSVTIHNNNNNNNNNKNMRNALDSDRGMMGQGHGKTKSVLQHQQQQQPQQVVVDTATTGPTPTESPLQVEMVQLLKLLDLEKYSKILAGYTLHEVHSMMPEEMAKLGLPPEAQIKLQSRLDPQKHSLQDMNGVIQLQAPGSAGGKQERVVMHSFPPNWQGHGHMPPPDPITNQSTAPLPHPSLPYPPIHQYHLVSPQNAIPSPLPPPGTDNSPCTSEQCTPSPSPGVNSLPDSPPSSLASPTSVYLEDKSAKNHQQVDSSGSEEDKARGQNFEGNESAPYKGNRGPNRPQQSISLPLLNSNASSPGMPEKGKVMGVPASLSAPVVANEAAVVREAGTPPMGPISATTFMNGFGGGTENHHSFLPHSIVMSLSALHHAHQQQQQQQAQQQQHHHQHHHRYKSAQPTHMGPRMHKNVVNMPHLDMNNQPPPPAPGINKNPIMLHHHHHHNPHQPHTHPYIIQQNNMIHPPQPMTTGNNAGNGSVNNTPQQQQQMQSGQPLMPPGLSTADNAGGNMTTLPFMPAIVPAGSNFMPPQSHGVMTTSMSMSNSSTTPGQPQQQAAASHSPSPVNPPSTSVQLDQQTQPPPPPAASGYNIHPNSATGGDGQQQLNEESHSGTPTPTSSSSINNNNKPTNPSAGHNNNNNTAATVNNNNGTLSHIPNMSRPGSGTATPSPPLHQPPPPPPPPPTKQMGVVATSDSSSSNHPQQQPQTMFVPPPPLYMIPNITAGNMSVSMPPYSTNPHHHHHHHPHHQQQPQHFPNGIAPEVYHLQTRFQLPMGSAGPIPPFYYGSQAFNPNPHIHHNNNNHHHHHNNNNNNNSNGPSHSHHATGNGNGGGGKAGGKNSCYNCGSSGHKANECKESHMDSMTKTYKLNIKPKSDSD